MTANYGAFLDQLYAAAVEPDLWAPAMERLADMLGGTSAWLSRLSTEDGSGSAITARIDPGAVARYEQYYGRVNPFATHARSDSRMRSWELKVVTDGAWMPKNELYRNEYFNDFMRPQAVDSFLVLRISARPYEVCSLTVNRAAGAGDYDGAQLDLAERLRPHVRRAFELSASLATAGVTGPEVGALLEHSGAALFILDDRGVLQRCNAAGERLLARRAGLAVHQGRLTARPAPAARQLGALIADACGEDAERRLGGRLTLRVAGRLTPLCVSVAPLRSASLAVFTQRRAILVSVNDPEDRRGPDAVDLQSLFGLTPAEARVALSLLSGSTLRETADRLGVSYHTARHQLQTVLDKTGARRQADLLALLIRAGGGSSAI